MDVLLCVFAEKHDFNREGWRDKNELMSCDFCERSKKYENSAKSRNTASREKHTEKRLEEAGYKRGRAEQSSQQRVLEELDQS